MAETRQLPGAAEAPAQPRTSEECPGRRAGDAHVPLDPNRALRREDLQLAPLLAQARVRCVREEGVDRLAAAPVRIAAQQLSDQPAARVREQMHPGVDWEYAEQLPRVQHRALGQGAVLQSNDRRVVPRPALPVRRLGERLEAGARVGGIGRGLWGIGRHFGDRYR